MTTNDPQAGYVAEKREPMLNDRAVSSMQKSYQFLFSGHDELNSEAWLIGALDMRKAYEAKIASGELMVCKTASLTPTDLDDLTWWACTECNTNVGEGIYQPKWKFCPGCGARIIE